MKSLKKLKHHDESKIKFNPAMEMGIAAHVFCLEGESAFNNEYMIYEDSLDRRTKAYKGLKIDAERMNKKLISENDYYKIKDMCQALRLHPIGRVLDQSRKEAVAFWEHSKTGIECKAKIDIIGDDFIADLKFTGKEIDPVNDYQLFNMVFERAYYRQMSFYKEAFDEVKHLYLIFIETESPHEITWVDLMDDENWLRLGRREIDIAMNRYIDFQAWQNGANVIDTGYSTEKRKVSCPKWALERVERLNNTIDF